MRGATPRPAHSASEHLAKGLGVFSLALGLVELFAARPLCRALGVSGHETLVQAYGVREIATGVAILASHDPAPWIYGRIAGDALDLGTLATAFDDNPRRGNLAIATAAAVGVALLDVACAAGLTADKRMAPPGSYDYGDRTGFPRPPAAMRGAASDLAVPADFRIPEPLRPWVDGRPAAA